MSMTDDLRSRLAEDDGSLPARWNAEDEPGTTLVGILLRFETIVTDFGEGTIAVIEDDDDSTVWGVALFRSVLKKRFELLGPKPGDTIGLKYVGFVEPRNKGSNGYHNYVMRVVHNTPTAVIAGPQDQGDEEELPF